MVGSINLIPQAERVQQTKTKVVKFSTVLSIFIFVITSAIGGFLYYQKSTLESEISAIDKNIERLRAEITDLDHIEVNARNLYKKTEVLEKIFTTKIYYSNLISAVDSSVPRGVFIDSFSIGQDNKISLSGVADKYDLIQDFSNNLLERDIFTDVSLNSVNLQSSTNTADFFIVVAYQEDELHE